MTAAARKLVLDELVDDVLDARAADAAELEAQAAAAAERLAKRQQNAKRAVTILERRDAAVAEFEDAMHAMNTSMKAIFVSQTELRVNGLPNRALAAEPTKIRLAEYIVAMLTDAGRSPSRFGGLKYRSAGRFKVSNSIAQIESDLLAADMAELTGVLTND